MNISSELILDSTCAGSRVSTFVLTLPKYLLQELNTHKTINKNAGSSRALPVTKVEAMSNFTPIYWSKNQPGMQGYDKIAIEDVPKATALWEEAKAFAKEQAKKLFSLGLHKQICNRLMEPFTMTQVIATSDAWTNFFVLRAWDDADPNFGYLSTLMLEQWLDGTPQALQRGEWHIPFLKEEDKLLSIEDQLKRSVARCARVSYLNFEGTNDLEKDRELHDKLIQGGHMSPFEHQVFADQFLKSGCYQQPWLAYRHTLPFPKRVDLRERLQYMKELNKFRGFTNE